MEPNQDISSLLYQKNAEKRLDNMVSLELSSIHAVLFALGLIDLIKDIDWGEPNPDL